MFQLLLALLIEYKEAIITLLSGGSGVLGTYLWLRKKDKEIESTQVEAKAQLDNADSAKTLSEAETANTISKLALQLNQSSTEQLSLIIDLQKQITDLSTKLATAQTALINAQDSIKKLEEQVKYYQEREESHKAARRQWEITQMELVKRISDIRKGDTDRLNETLPLPDLPKDPDAVEPPTKPPEVTPAEASADNAINDDDENKDEAA